MRILRIVASLSAVALVACTANPGRPTGAASPDRSPAPRVKAMPAEAASIAPGRGGFPSGKPASLERGALPTLAGLAQAFHEALPAADAAGIQYTVGIVANNGGSFISDKGGGIVGNNSAGIVGNNSSGLISDNGALLISDKGAGATGGPRARQLLQAPGDVFWRIEHAEPDLVYVTTFYNPDFRGQAIGYAPADFKAQGEAAPEQERLAWDPLRVTPVDDPASPPDLATGELALLDVRYPVRVVKSPKLAFTRRIDLDMRIAITAFQPKLLTRFKQMTGDFTLDVPLRLGGAEPVALHADVFRYPPGAGPAEMTGTTYPTPTGFSAAGEGPRGRIELTVDGAVQQRMSGRFVATDGRITAFSQERQADGTVARTLRDEAAGAEVRLLLAPGRGGEALVTRIGGGEPLATLIWQVDGSALLRDAGGATEPLRLF